MPFTIPAEKSMFLNQKLFLIKIRILVRASCLLLLIGCVEQLSLENDITFQPELVVEGAIDDYSEFFTVTISTTWSNRGVGVNTLGQNATVQILQENGESVLLQEILPGTYRTQTGALKPTQGCHYTLDIVLQNGENYQSSAVVLPQKVSVVSMRSEFVDLSGQDDQGTFFKAFAHDIYATIENADTTQFFKMDVTGWEEMRVAYLVLVLAPETCWALREPALRQINVNNNTGIATPAYEVKVATIPANVRGRYIAEVLFSSMSREAMNFWEVSSEQLNRQGDVFSAPFPTIVGNIRNINDPREVVHGYFHAYSRTLSRTCFDTHGLPLFYEIPVLGIPCSEFFAPAVDYLPFEDELCNE